MACSKYTLKNVGATTAFFNYRRCDDAIWFYDVSLRPGQSRNIWLINGTYSSKGSNIVITEQSPWPPPPPPTPSNTPSAPPKTILELSVDIKSGSLVFDYLIVANQVVTEQVRVNFVNTYGLFDGGEIYISTGITINVGEISGSTRVEVPFQDSTNLNGYTTFEGDVSIPADFTLQIDQLIVDSIITTDGSPIIVGDNFYLSFINIIPTPTPTPSTSVGSVTQTPTVTPTLTNTPTNTQTQVNFNTPTSTETPPVTPTNSVTPSVTVTNTGTPNITPTSSITPSVTQTPPLVPFISVWNIASPYDAISLPLVSGGTYSFTVNWGDGNSDVITSWNQVEKTHQYALNGEYTVTISGTIEGFSFGESLSPSYSELTEIQSWGILRLGDSGGNFKNCNNLVLTGVSDSLNLSSVSNLSEMFYGCSSLTTINNVGNWSLINVTGTSYMFYGSTFNDDITNWITLNVTDMSYMFSGATQFNQPINTIYWDVSNVTDMSYMFADADSFNQDISGWDISNVTNFVGFMSGKDYTNFTPSNYDNLLNSWSTLPVNNSLTIDFGNIRYTSTGLSGRNILTSPPRSWTINDGGPYVAPTPTPTPTNTGTPLETPTNTPTSSVTPSFTPTNTPTLTQTPTPTPAPIYPFVSVFRTTSPDESITLPYVTGGTYSGIIDWGDGSLSANSYSNRTHTYSTAGDYTISVSGTTSGFNFGYTSASASKIRSVVSWGDLYLGNTSPGYYFQGCSNLNLTTVSDILNTSGITNMTEMFSDCSSLSTINNVGSWNVSSVTGMSYMFNSTGSFNSNINSWNVSNVTDFTNMFLNSTLFNQPLSGWNTSAATTMIGMFMRSSFNQPIGNWNTSNVVGMRNMFRGNVNFNQNIGSWDTSKVTNMSAMFYDDTTKPTGSVFNNGGSDSIKNWVLTANTTTAGMFASLYYGHAFNQPIGSWDMSNVTNTSDMFSYNQSFNQPLSGWNVSNVTRMDNMFYFTTFNQNISNWNVSKVTNMSSMFASSLFNQPIGSWSVSAVTTMTGMFSNSQFNQPISGWNVSNVVTMSTMFNTSNFNQNINNWNVTGVTNMNSMFSNASNFNQPLSGWVLTSIQSMTNFMAFKSNYSSSYLDDIYNTWSTLSIPTGITVSFGTSKYTYLSQSGRDVLTGSIPTGYSWTITDGGVIGPTPTPSITPTITPTTTITPTVTPTNTVTPTTSRTIAFRTTWQDPDGVQTIAELPLISGGGKIGAAGYPLTVNWGDGNISALSSETDPSRVHIYADEQAYQVSITSNLKYIFSFGKSSVSQINKNMLKSIDEWGTFEPSETRLFEGCEEVNLSTVVDIFNTNNTFDLEKMFYGCSGLTTINNIENWNMTNVTGTTYMFSNTSFTAGSLIGWDTSNITNMRDMFAGNPVFNADIETWVVSGVTNMRAMFSDANNFNQDITSWDVSNVTSMVDMFKNAYNFNKDIRTWDVSSVLNMEGFMLGKTPENYDYYDVILLSWSSLPLQSSVTADFGTLRYSTSAASARQSIIDNYSWTINDGGPN